ncbi:MAG: type II toxin-antitoxin system VapC family toxin [Candidatus Korarchaeota archaeon]|nr:type II toxin-antitoxin system VapC family toxin [Candidatus Korarchaeota archaeon]NIU82337.1 PIN domain-containing protein [Candidatus Thorarchaeota archaeon]NIW12821.1 PIN domain-containing protein [Candidatus Thorarchaeota archaeon]NIW51014.1 PIN domain-containing protein [Candidatus Korarchaeota archaeon]
MTYLFDTMALITFFNDETGADFVEKALKEVEQGETEGFISALTLTELYYLYSQEEGEDVARERVEQVRVNLQVVSIDERIALKAGEYKKKSVPIADAFIAASAHSINASVMTNDEHFKQLDVEVVMFE